jgi:predicted nucleotidyltransferase component of viral defense system
MITEQELRQAAVQAEMGVGQVEHEYVMLCALDALHGAVPLGSLLCLKGGTALRLLYFADWRHSVDLDFSALPGLSTDALRPFVETWFGRVEQLHGVSLQICDFHRANGAVRLRAQFVGLSYALEEILAEKVRSILERGKARDYYDVWQLLKEKSRSFDAVTTRRTLLTKCENKGLPAPTVERLLAPELLAGARAYWEQDLASQVIVSALPAWEVITGDLPALSARFLAIEDCIQFIWTDGVYCRRVIPRRNCHHLVNHLPGSGVGRVPTGGSRPCKLLIELFRLRQLPHHKCFRLAKIYSALWHCHDRVALVLFPPWH